MLYKIPMRAEDFVERWHFRKSKIRNLRKNGRVRKYHLERAWTFRQTIHGELFVFMILHGQPLFCLPQEVWEREVESKAVPLFGIYDIVCSVLKERLKEHD